MVRTVLAMLVFLVPVVALAQVEPLSSGVTSPLSPPLVIQPTSGVGDNGSTPVPDPTILTSQALEAAISDLKELMEVRIRGVEARIDAILRDIDLLPEETRREIGHLRELVDQKFEGVRERFEGQAASVLALDKSNSEAIEKSETATAKQIETLSGSITTITGPIDEKVDDARLRIQAIESRAVGVVDNRSDNESSWVLVFGIIASIVGLFSIISAIVVAVIAFGRRQVVTVVNGHEPKSAIGG